MVLVVVSQLHKLGVHNAIANAVSLFNNIPDVEDLGKSGKPTSADSRVKGDQRPNLLWHVVHTASNPLEEIGVPDERLSSGGPSETNGRQESRQSSLPS